MANTRNKNTPGNYCLDQKQIANADRWTMYINGANGHAYDSKLAGNGFNPGQVPSNVLSSNPTDIESFLRGTNLNNMVNPAKSLVPELKCVPMKNMYKSARVIMPIPLVAPNDQRPFPIPM